MDDEFCRERARAVRAIAEQADPLIKRRLLQLAQHYERRVRLSEGNKNDRDPDRKASTEFQN
ncbi:hypothetical protein OZ411_14050 [Bradyrhizobium sp. Arg237L]|uniref:hypothetical protein n=1 Tax=Bradyrhizobium sp. Arg237L TaxID=3003352 RepID=UPI00249E0DCA|nr:hypothetical protein [Bradyrhizobium sp. Arg237L]MDI4233938.1 hypothetical protein [Bradyrhizobium sp. Arg237L]